MILDFIEIKTIYLIFHLFGIALGAGGAFASDLIFFKSIKDGQLTKTEFGFMELGSKMIWAGLGVLVISGTLLFFLNPEGYMASSKFQLKMTVVAIIIANGIVLHLNFIPKLKAATKIGDINVAEFVRQNPFILVSGVVSMVSWSSAIILGALRGIPYSYWLILAIYLAIILCGIAAAFLLKPRMFPKQ
ncbi:MAG TPA: hypothetical protein VFE94_00320 [Candidatus Paceibacterota bacterium]|nr:hypothetical protein [Candidatus Paceibacterota bacterium]